MVKGTAHNDPMYDRKAIDYANKHGFHMTAGSDIHSVNMFGGGVLFNRRIRTIEEFIELIKVGDYLLSNGDDIFNARGERIEYE